MTSASGLTDKTDPESKGFQGDNLSEENSPICICMFCFTFTVELNIQKQ